MDEDYTSCLKFPINNIIKQIGTIVVAMKWCDSGNKLTVIFPKQITLELIIVANYFPSRGSDL
jgi:hypothetical protein